MDILDGVHKPAAFKYPAVRNDVKFSEIHADIDDSHVGCVEGCMIESNPALPPARQVRKM